MKQQNSEPKALAQQAKLLSATACGYCATLILAKMNLDLEQELNTKAYSFSKNLSKLERSGASCCMKGTGGSRPAAFRLARHIGIEARPSNNAHPALTPSIHRTALQLPHVQGPRCMVRNFCDQDLLLGSRSASRIAFIPAYMNFPLASNYWSNCRRLDEEAERVRGREMALTCP